MIDKYRMTSLAEKYQINLNDQQLDMLDTYAQMLVQWNENVNLTAITQPEEIEIKHFLDSLTALQFCDGDFSIIDVGTGAGFPGLVLKIANQALDLTLLDSLDKRLTFLKAVSENIGVDAQFAHFRAEDAGQMPEFREQYDISIARAVASLNVLCEFCLPMVKIGGKFIAMKGKSAPEEIKLSENAILTLGGEIDNIHQFKLPNDDERSIIIIRKVKCTDKAYPRRYSAIKKKPL